MAATSPTILTVAIAALAIIAPPAQSAPDGSAVPPGSYLQTCHDLHLASGLLTAWCDGGNPPPKQTGLVVAACDGDISNRSGSLFCFARPGTWGQGLAVPRGSYLQSCWDARVDDGPRLVAACLPRDSDTAVWTSLDLRQCRLGSEISNHDGQLICIN
jgi:hypothetical protein